MVWNYGKYDWNSKDEHRRKGRTWMVSVMVDAGADSPIFVMQKYLDRDEAERFADDVVRTASEGEWPVVFNTFLNPDRIVSVRIAEERDSDDQDRDRDRDDRRAKGRTCGRAHDRDGYGEDYDD